MKRLFTWLALQFELLAGNFLVAMGLPIGAGGVLDQKTLQALATWDGGNWSTLAPGGAFTIAAAAFLNGSTTFMTVTGAPGAVNATTPTATLLQQQFQNAYGAPPTVGSTWQFELSNTTASILTLVGGTGVTINGTATVAATANRLWLCTFTAVGPNPAVTVQNLSSRSN